MFSAFLNNTPIVAMMIPVVNDWSKRTKLPVSRLMMVCTPHAAHAVRGCTLLTHFKAAATPRDGPPPTRSHSATPPCLEARAP